MAAEAAALGGHLPKDELTAFQKAYDADAPSNEIVIRTEQEKTAQSGYSNLVGRDFPPDHEIPYLHSESTSIDVKQAGDSEKAQPSSIAEERDPNIVFWDGDDDPANPLNWSASKKWTNIAILSALTFLTPLASSMFAPGVPDVMREFHADSDTLATFVVSIYILGFAFGPLIMAPMSELYGRLIVYQLSNVGFIAFTIACAVAPSLSSLIAFRFLQGVFGCTPVTIGGGTIADLIVAEKRGGALAIWAMGPLLGPVVGPVAGGFLSDAKSWRWIFWVITMATGFVAILAIFFFHETYTPVILSRKTKRLRKETGNPFLVSKLDSNLTPKELFIRAIVRPAKLMFFSPICALMSLYVSVIYGFLYLLFTTFTFVFEDNYNFSQSTVGLSYLGMGIGNFIGLILMGSTSDRTMKWLAKKNNGPFKPEYRLPLLIYLGPLVPLGLFIYGWTTQYKIQWAVPLLGTLFFGIGMIAAFMCINTYLVDTFGLYAASAMAANTVLRSIFGAVFPLFALQMYAALGLGWGNSLLAFIGVAMLPIPWVFYTFGERIRTAPRFQVKF